jgi:hypothetical protein
VKGDVSAVLIVAGLLVSVAGCSSGPREPSPRVDTPAMEASDDPSTTGEPPSVSVAVRRLENNPIIKPGMDDRMGSNIQGPSLIRVPDWLPDPLGRYYHYFADHKGSYIRLAFANRLEGPWTVHTPGSLQVEQSHFRVQPAEIPAEIPEIDLAGFARGPVDGVPAPIESATKPHIASPDVHVRGDRREIVMYFHGLEGFRVQFTRGATSKNGIDFTAGEERLGYSYMRAFDHEDQWYAMSMPGVFYRSKDGLSGFEEGPRLFSRAMRHSALLKRGNDLLVFWTRVGDTPEHILLSTIDLSGDWSAWRASEPVSVLFPEEDWEGGDVPLEASVRDAINARVRQLRDPAIFVDGDQVYLLYAVAGEAGIAIAEIEISGP